MAAKKSFTITYDVSNYTNEDKNKLYIARLIGYNNYPSYTYTKRKGDVLRNYSDTSKANSVLGWKALTELEDGLLLTVKEFIK